MLEVRAAVIDDLPALTAIYNHYVVNSHATFDLEPFSVEARQAWFAQYAETGRHRLIVAAQDGAPAGYTTSSRFRPKDAYLTSVETTVYLSPDAAGRGIGRALYTALFDALAGEDVHRAYAGISLPNEASIALHERFGFRRAGLFTEQGRKFGRYWDVAWYEKQLS